MVTANPASCTDGSDRSDGQVKWPRSPAADEQRQGGDEKWLESAGGGSDTSGQPVHGNGEQGEEDREVERGEEACAPPVCAPRPPAGDPRTGGEQYDTGREHAH